MMNDELNKSCEKWENSPANARTYADFCCFIIKWIIQIENRKGTLATAKIANIVEESTKQSTKILLGKLLMQAETIRQLSQLALKKLNTTH